MSFNKIILVGNLGRDPELRYTPQGVAVCDFSLATNDRRRDKSGEYQDVPTWFRVTVWRTLAETAAKYLKKGRLVYIEGRLTVEEWTDREGNPRQTLAVQATDMHFIAQAGDERMHAGEPAAESTEDAPADDLTSTFAAETTPPNDDIPF